MTHNPGEKQAEFTLDYAACSDRGLVRGNNEDSGYAGPRLLALADGMGGHAAGEVASALMIDALKPLDSPLIDEEEYSERLETLLVTAMDEGNQAIAAHVDANPTLAGMGCTLDALLFRGNEVGLCHVGDSRVYRLRDGALEQITKDDTFVQTLVEQGKLDPADVSSHPQRSLILKALTGRPVEPTVRTERVQAGDRYLLCSDGLSDPVSFDTIAEILRSSSPSQAARKLVEMALRGGGPDNVTVVIADVVEYDATTGAPLNPAATLPRNAVLVGAVAGDAIEEEPRPDSPAARAAALGGLKTTHAAHQPTDSTPGDRNGNAPRDQAAADKDTNASSARKIRGSSAGRPKLWTALAVVLLVLAGLAAAGYVGYNKIKENYYVAEADSRIVINQGTPTDILGFKLSTAYQEICLSEESTVRLLDSGASDNCHRFATSDLTPAARGALANLPEGDYGAVVQQVHRLAEQTLPPCITRSPSPNGAASSAPDTDKPGGGAASGTNTPADPPTSTEGAKPTGSTPPPTNSAKPTENANQKTETNRAPEDLTTPGVSCREVN